MMFFCRRIQLRLLLLLVLAIIFCTVSADQMGLISSSDELINGPEDGNSQYTNPGSWALTPSEAAINDVGIGIAPSIMVDESAGAGAGLAGNSIKAVDNCANIPKNSRRGVQVQLRKKRQPPDWCDNRQKPATFSGTSGGDSDSDGTISDPTREAPPKATPILKPKPGSDSDGDDTNSAPTRKAPPKAKPILKPKPAGDTSTIQQPPTTSEAEESTFKDLQQVFLRLGGGTICNTQLEYFRYQYPVCFPYAMGGKGRRFSANRAWWENWFGLTVESGSLRKDLFPCRPTLIPECYSNEEFWCCEKISQLPDPLQIERNGQLSSPDMVSAADPITYSIRGTWCVFQSAGAIAKPLPRARPEQ